MAGPGGGPPRRSHTKSRKGCDTCKRRHIRCDENFPQCRNCTKHNCRCPYMDMPAQDERAPTPEKPDLLWTPEIEAHIELWQQTGNFPFPDLFIYPVPDPRYLPIEDLRILYHVAAISRELTIQDTGNFTIWTRQIPLFIKIGATNGFVLSALLAFGATHLGWLTDCQLVNRMAYEHRGNAIKGLQEAIGSFSRDNSDAVLAASLLLSWQATEWRSWTQLMHGTSSVIDAMQPWKNESQFGEFIAEQSTFPTEHPSPNPNSKQLSAPRRRDLEALQFAYSRLQRVEEHLRNNNEDTHPITQLMSFVRSVRKLTPNHTAAQRFEMLNPLRAWLFWLPILFLQQTQGSSSVLVILAHYYTVALVVEPLFPEVGAAYFGSLSVGPIEEIARRLFSINVSQTSESDMSTPLSLMEYPIDMVSKFRSRMGWIQPERTASFPTFEQSHFKLEPSEDNSIYNYGNPAYNYSSESLMLPSTPVSATISPLTLEPYSQQFLGIPSPGGFGGYHSPASSIYGGGDGSIAYSEGEEYMYDLHHGSGQGFGGPSSSHPAASEMPRINIAEQFPEQQYFPEHHYQQEYPSVTNPDLLTPRQQEGPYFKQEDQN